jgi:hypothetical protein
MKGHTKKPAEADLGKLDCVASYFPELGKILLESESGSNGAYINIVIIFVMFWVEQHDHARSDLNIVCDWEFVQRF